jgi:hypothetical protein
MSGWQHRHGAVIQGSKDVIIEIWKLPNRIVKVSMMQRSSVDDARERLSQFTREETDVQELKGSETRPTAGETKEGTSFSDEANTRFI